MFIKNARRLVRLAAICLAAAPYTLTAQVTASTPIASDSFMSLVPPRAPTAISSDLGAVAQYRASAEEAERSAIELRRGADSRIAAKKRQISEADSKRKLAERQKQDAEVTALKAEKQALEREKDLLERRKSLREAEIDLAKKRREMAELARQSLELERQLMIKRAESSGVVGGGAASARSSQVLFDLEQATLEAQRKRADKEQDVVAREKKVIERRLEILQAQRRVISGG